MARGWLIERESPARALLLLLGIGLAGCPEQATPLDQGPPPGAVFYSPQAVAAGARHVLVGSTGFHLRGTRGEWDPGFVTLIDRSSRQVVALIPTSQRNPQAIAVHGDRAYVVCSGTFWIGEDGIARTTSDGAIDILDLGGAVPHLLGTIPLGRSPKDTRIGAYGSIALDAAGRLALVGSGTRGDLFKVDLEARQVLRGPDSPIALFSTPPDKNGLTTVRALTGGVFAVLDYNTDALCISKDLAGDLAQRSCGKVGVQDKLLEGPIDLARAPDGRLLVLMTIANSLYRVDVAEPPFAVEHAFAKTGLANNRVLVHDGQAYVVNTMSNNLQRVEVATGQSDLPFAVLPVGSRPYDAVITQEAAGDLAWVTLNGAHALAVVDLADGRVLDILSGGAVSDGGGGDLVDAGVPDAAADQGPSCPEAGLPAVVGIGNVVAVTYGAGAGDGQDKLPGIIQGGPSGAGSGSGSTDQVLSLGVGGEIVVDFGDYDIVDGPGPDFIVFENPFLTSPYSPFAEPALVAVSETSTAAASFVPFPCDLSQTQGDPSTESWPFPGCAGVRPVLAGPEVCIPATDPDLAGGDPFDLADVGVPQARYLRLTDAGISQLGNTSKGFDLDAVVLIHYKKR